MDVHLFWILFYICLFTFNDVILSPSRLHDRVTNTLRLRVGLLQTCWIGRISWIFSYCYMGRGQPSLMLFLDVTYFLCKEIIM